MHGPLSALATIFVSGTRTKIDGSHDRAVDFNDKLIITHTNYIPANGINALYHKCPPNKRAVS
jgi:hypothetical protein